MFVVELRKGVYLKNDKGEETKDIAEALPFLSKSVLKRKVGQTKTILSKIVLESKIVDGPKK